MLKSSTTPKSFQTQSLSNIAINSLNHSTSDNDLDKQQQQKQNLQDLDDNDVI